MRFLLLICLWLATSCVPQNISNIPITSTPAVSDPVYTEIDGVGVHLTMGTPWLVYNDLNHVILTREQHHIDDDDVPVDDWLITIWRPTIEKWVTPEPEHTAHDILSVIFAKTCPPHTRLMSPIAFEWHGHDAAYYLLEDDHEVISLIIGVMIPEAGMLAFNLSAPRSQMDELTTEVFMLFDHIHIHGDALGSTALHGIFEALEF